jgi:hypothetical protein
VRPADSQPASNVGATGCAVQPRTRSSKLENLADEKLQDAALHLVRVPRLEQVREVAQLERAGHGDPPDRRHEQTQHLRRRQLASRALHFGELPGVILVAAERIGIGSDDRPVLRQQRAHRSTGARRARHRWEQRALHLEHDRARPLHCAKVGHHAVELGGLVGRRRVGPQRRQVGGLDDGEDDIPPERRPDPLQRLGRGGAAEEQEGIQVERAAG